MPNYEVEIIARVQVRAESEDEASEEAMALLGYPEYDEYNVTLQEEEGDE